MTFPMKYTGPGQGPKPHPSLQVEVPLSTVELQFFELLGLGEEVEVGLVGWVEAKYDINITCKMILLI